MLFNYLVWTTSHNSICTGIKALIYAFQFHNVIRRKELNSSILVKFCLFFPTHNVVHDFLSLLLSHMFCFYLSQVFIKVLHSVNYF